MAQVGSVSPWSCPGAQLGRGSTRTDRIGLGGCSVGRRGEMQVVTGTALLLS